MDYERAAAIAAESYRLLAEADERLADVDQHREAPCAPEREWRPEDFIGRSVGQMSRVEWDAYCRLGKPPLEINQRKIAPVAPPPAPQPEPGFTPEMIDALGAVIAGERQRMRQHVEQELAAVRRELDECRSELAASRTIMGRRSPTPPRRNAASH